MESFNDRQSRLLWRAAVAIYAVMSERDELDRVSRIASAWQYLTSDTRELFPLLLMEPIQTSVTDRLVQITQRARRGLELCPEIA